jgi:hypothetical protein
MSIHLSLAKNNFVNLLIDTDAEISLVKKNLVKDKAICNTNLKAQLKGIAENESFQFYGVCFGDDS